MTTSQRTEIIERIRFRKAALAAARKALVTILDGGVTEYMIGDRQATKLDVPKLKKIIDDLEKEIDGLENKLNGRKGRRAFAVVPTNW